MGSSLLLFFFFGSGKTTIPLQSAYDPSVHLSLADMSVDSQTNPHTVILRIKASKTDQYRIGVNISLGRTNNDLCPVVAVLSYISCRGTTDGLLFHFENDSPLTRDAFVKEVLSVLRLAGVNAKHYSSQSFCIGVATSAAGVCVQVHCLCDTMHMSTYTACALSSDLYSTPENMDVNKQPATMTTAVC